MRRSRRLAAAPILFAAFALAAGPAAAKTIRLGLVAGHNRGMENSVDLRYAENDAQKMGDLFSEVGGLEPANLILLKSPRPAELDRAFEEMRAKGAQATPGDEVIFLFYFSGHGQREHLELGRHLYPLKDLKERIERVPAKLRIGIFDACQSGAITRLKGVRKVEPFLLEQNLKSNGSILITSSAEHENSQESDQVRGSFFTHHWLSALRGAGDVSGDKRVSLLEAYQYAYQRTLVHTEGTRGGAQHPSAQFKLDVQGDVILTDLNAGEGGLDFQPDLAGDLLVANSNSDVLGEFHKLEGKATFMALPPGKYRIFLRDGRKTRQGKVTLRGGESKPVGESDLGSGFQFTGLVKGSGNDNGNLDPPWKQADWSSQFPLQIAFGWYNQTYLYGSQIGIVSYEFMDPLSLVLSGVINKENPHAEAYTWKHLNLDVRVALQVAKFLSPNIEFLASGGYRWHVVARKGTVREPYCASYGCGEYVSDHGDRYARPLGLNIRYGARAWLWNHLSLEMTYGTEFAWIEKKFNSDFLYVAPSLHF